MSYDFSFFLIYHCCWAKDRGARGEAGIPGRRLLSNPGETMYLIRVATAEMVQSSQSSGFESGVRRIWWELK